MANKVTGVRIDPELWKRVRMRAVETGRSASAIVEEAVETYLANELGAAPRERFVGQALRQRLGAWATVADRAPGGPRPAEPIDMATDTVVVVGGVERVGERHPDTRCECGVAWKDHQAGASGRLAVRTNCRSFRAAS